MSDLELPRQADRSWWLEEALAHPEFAGEPCPPLRGDATADVVIVGGGYTGLWSAYFLKEREPDLDVVLLEQDICGGGPSGRNGGFVNAFYDELEFLVDRFGPEGRRAAELAAASLDGIGAWCELHGVDAWYTLAGDLGISTSPAMDAEVEDAVEQAWRMGVDEIYRPLDAGEVRERFDSPLARGGVLVTHAASVQPARLARGLRRVLLERGVRIFEQTPVSRFRSSPAVVAETPSGRVRAGRAIVAVNAWAIAWRELRRLLMVRGTYMVVTEPAPERLEAIGWTGGEGVYDFRTTLHYLRTTNDGRIAFGGTPLRIADRRIGPRYRYDEASVAWLVEDFRRWFPSFGGVRLEAAWGGPVDVSGWHLPTFGSLPGGLAHFGVGFTGNGVGPCHLGGRILSGLALDVEDETTSLPLVDADPKPFPREPLFTPGERLVSGAIRRKEDLEDRRRRPDPITNALAHVPRRLGFNLGP
jgi:glycine/D-amino acid oxidase-like deaminating enzyme